MESDLPEWDPRRHMRGDFGELILAPDVAAELLETLGLERMAIAARAANPRLYGALTAWRMVALRADSADRGSLTADRGRTVDADPTPGSYSEVMYDTKQASELTGRSQRTIREACRVGALSAEQVGANWIIRHRDLMAFKADLRRKG